MKDFQQIDWDQQIEEDCRELIRLAMREDLADGQDWTTVALVPADCRGTARIVAREAGVVAGLPALQAAIDEMRADLTLTPTCAEGDSIPAETCLATLQGNVRDLLTCERILLNLLGRLIGIATMAREYVEAVAGTPIRVYDTRKTTPGWRRLEKYAVRCGGAHNHRTGLFDAMLIKDNHLAMLATEEKEILSEGQGRGAGWAVECARKFLASNRQGDPSPDCLIEVEVDTLQQLAAVLSVQPDIVLLDNMPPAMLREAVQMRNLQAPQIQLEASGGVSLGTIREIAESGVDRISVGALTIQPDHSTSGWTGKRHKTRSKHHDESEERLDRPFAVLAAKHRNDRCCVFAAYNRCWGWLQSMLVPWHGKEFTLEIAGDGRPFDCH